MIDITELSFPEKEEEYIYYLLCNHLKEIVPKKEFCRLEKLITSHDLTLEKYVKMKIYYKGALVKEPITDLTSFNLQLKNLDNKLKVFFQKEALKNEREMKEKERKNKEEEKTRQESRQQLKNKLKEKRLLKIDGYDVMEACNVMPSPFVGEILRLIFNIVNKRKRKYRTKIKQMAVLYSIINDLKYLSSLKNKENI